MATAKKGGKSTKTAHVLNLLTAPGTSVEREADTPQEEDAAPAASAPEPEAQPAPSSRPLTPPILEVARSNDEQISEQIRDALESALLEELGETPPQSPPAEPESEPEPIPAPPPPVEPEPEPEPIPEPVPAEALEPALEPEPILEPEPAPAPEPVLEPPKPPEPVKPPEPPKPPEPVKPPEPAKPPEPVKPPEPPKPDLVVLNVMEKLVELKAPRYISMFGLCSCERCAADVRALTLTNLQPHYIVVPQKEVNATITIFESRFNSTIFAQLTRACKIVMDNPRHKM